MEDLLAERRPFIGGRFVPGGAHPFAVADPSTEKVITDVDGASIEQFEAAVSGARAAFDQGSWGNADPGERVAALRRFGRSLASRREPLIETVIAETGCPRTITETAQVDLALQSVDQLVELAERLPSWEHNEQPFDDHLVGDQVRLSVRRYEPVGVVAAITPYNFPTITNVWKVVPALLAGCTVVLRPSPLTPVEALVFGEAAQEAGLPAGVLNIVAESGAAGGELLTTHPDVDLVSFTGSTGVGRQIMAQGASTMKRLILELGGKSVQLHLPDALADGPQAALPAAMAVFSSHAGQGCALQTRMLVPAEHRDAVAEAVAAAAAALPIGDPRDPSTLVGPLISQAQLERVEGLVDEGVSAGGRLVCGGQRAGHLPQGWYYEPTVLTIDDNRNPVAQQEVFGPVLTVQGYRDVDEAVAIANDSEYGLSGGVYTDDLAAGTRVADRIRSGTVQVNVGCSSGYTAMGGMKQSGIGRERGALGIRAFQESKHIVVAGRS